MKTTLGNLTVEGANEREMDIAFSYLARLATFAAENPQACAPIVARGGSVRAMNGEASATDYCAQWLASALNVKGAIRFRMSAEEIEKHGEGDAGRQQAAHARLVDGGETVGDGKGPQAGASVTLESGEGDDVATDF